jgi:transcriptional regulator with XRE-family HTH domain
MKVARSMVHRLLHGDPDPQFSTLQRVASALGMTIAELMVELGGRAGRSASPSTDAHDAIGPQCGADVQVTAGGSASESPIDEH